MAGGSTLHIVSSAAAKHQRPVVAFDLDEVLGQYLATYTKWHNRVYGTHLRVSDFFTYRFWEVQGGTAQEAIEKCYIFHESPEFKSGIPLVPGAQEYVRKITNFAEVHIVTSRQEVVGPGSGDGIANGVWSAQQIRQDTYDWVFANFGIPSNRVHLGNHFGLSGKKTSKADMCKAIGATLLIDDNPMYINDALSHGFGGILYDYDHG
ncbi:conserved hypothetical protein [Perkinsus marinus ATCC 50983]|uniref:Uncharacterized protein n=1 Tax=Perkinsus marinus (strain ATCC 50983 / TXsc) TaxID=423536 RepID=C5LMS1_PERM5|nr:conserved hypothetical protein [Perkinsus marinus ATCC 50983]EER01962.1 conserved hypothetical protein [Perkinsus marinus ATCC 50983]|eukprot:XP_002769244.1 conserved hypothetical protein [Perkinsus marinus ATCC 50983]